jgi:predicted RNA-binding Zn-ribbon protein involved in translation (DUF1610 family)
MKFYRLVGKENQEVKNGFRDYFEQCKNAPLWESKEKLINKKIFCKKCKSLLIEYKQPKDNTDVMIDAYWYIYKAKNKRIFCKKCNRGFKTNKIDVNLFECPQCGKMIKDYRGGEFLCTQGLLAYIIRQDGHLGLECSCGADTRDIACTDSKKADLKDEKCLFKIESEE